jgi:serine/threonine-protein kinase
MVDEAENNQNEKLDKIVQEFLAAQLRGEEPDLEQLVRQHPGLEDKIRQKVQNCQHISSLFDSLRKVDETEFQHAKYETDLTGTRLGAFEITEVIGRGGMGVVYKGHDTRLDRSIAIKSLPPVLINNVTAQTRFMREAKLLASLNHPNIAVIHDIIEQTDGSAYLVLEYVPGQTLAERIRDGRLPVKETLSIALQIAEALMAAYERGIVHRDLKPGNIKITPDGNTKVLDFGIAKTITRAPAAGAGFTMDGLPTETKTQAGHLIGTPAYMSPEQARGRPTDHRADIWSFGCVLYEMLTVTVAFEGETISDTIARVIERAPDWDRLPSDLPANIRVLLRRCLEKNTCDRLQHIGDAAVEIRETLNPPAVAPPLETIGRSNVSSARWRIATAFWFIGFVLGALTVAPMVSMYFGRSTLPSLSRPSQRMVINLPEKHTIASARMMPLGEPETTLAISPDGSRIVYAAATGDTMQLYLRTLDDFASRPIAGTEGGFAPFFSPDSQSVGFFTRSKLRTISLRGGQPITLCDTSQPKGACWGSDGMIYFAEAEGGRLSRIPTTGGRSEHLAVRTEVSAQGSYTYGYPQLLPDGEHLLLSSRTSVILFSLADRGKMTLIEKGQHARYIPTGHILYAWAGAIQAVPFDLKGARVIGSPTVVLDGILLDSVLGTTQMSVSDNGTLVYVPGGDTVKSVPVWIDRMGQTEPLGLPAAVYGMFRLSPDGQQLCIQRKDGTLDDIYIWDLVYHRLTRLTRDRCCRYPVWTPDGKHVVFSYRDDPRIIAWQSLDGASDIEPLYTSRHLGAPYSWSPRGDELYYRKGDKWMAVSISTEPKFSAGAPHELFEGPYLNVPGTSYDVSPDVKRFVVLQPEHDDSSIHQINVVLNWFGELGRLDQGPKSK